MVKITQAALTVITEEVKEIIEDGNKPIVRLSMGIG